VTWYRFIAEDGSRVQILRSVTEDEVLECFVLAERDSERYGERVRALLEHHQGDVRAVLADYRSYGRDDNVFSGFPEDVSWYRARLSKDELLEILYIKWDWWLTVTKGSRRPLDAAVNQGRDPGDEAIAKAAGANPSVIAVRAPESYLVLLEGHVRLTAYAAFPEHVPDELEIYLGESPRMSGWALY
jgi:hypothetical protein